MCKSGGADRYLDLVDSAGSILDRGSRIGRLGFNQRGEAAAQSAGGACPRRGFAGVEKSGAPGAYSDRGLAVEHPLGMRNPPVRSGQWIGPRGVVLAGDGEVGRRNIAGGWRISHGSGLISLFSDATEIGDHCGAHQGSRTSKDDVQGCRR